MSVDHPLSICDKETSRTDFQDKLPKFEYVSVTVVERSAEAHALQDRCALRLTPDVDRFAQFRAISNTLAILVVHARSCARYQREAWDESSCKHQRFDTER